MKKLLILFFAPVLGYGQILTDILYLEGNSIYPYDEDNQGSYNYQTSSGLISDSDAYDIRNTKFTVPEGKIWLIKHIFESSYRAINSADNMRLMERFYERNDDTRIIYEDDKFPDVRSNYTYDEGWSGKKLTAFGWDETESFYLKEGVSFRIVGRTNYLMVIYEYTFNNDNSFSYSNPIKTDSNIVMYPNPTSSLLALNSDKQYDIEVYDIAGNKVMALSGNTINMAHLSTATYIVNAIDKETNEKLSYKVIKN